MAALLLAAPLAAGPVAADSAATRDALPSFDTQLPGAWELLLGAWLPRFEGTVAWNGGTQFEAGDLGLDSLQASFAGDLFWQGEWLRLGVGGFAFSTSGQSTLPAGTTIGPAGPLDAPTRADASVDLWSVQAQIAVTLYQPFAAERTPWGTIGGARGVAADGSKVDFAIDAIGAIRYLSLSQSITPEGGERIAFDHAALGLGVGAGIRFRWEPGPRLRAFEWLSVFANGAGGPALFADGGWFVQFAAGVEIGWAPGISAQFGYRLLDFRIAEGGNLSRSGLQGLFVGGSIRF
jgi:hypothetical protein